MDVQPALPARARRKGPRRPGRLLSCGCDHGARPQGRREGLFRRGNKERPCGAGWSTVDAAGFCANAVMPSALPPAPSSERSDRASPLQVIPWTIGTTVQVRYRSPVPRCSIAAMHRCAAHLLRCVAGLHRCNASQPSGMSCQPCRDACHPGCDIHNQGQEQVCFHAVQACIAARQASFAAMLHRPCALLDCIGA